MFVVVSGLQKRTHFMVSMENSVQESIDITGSESISSKAVLRGYLMNLHLKRVWMIQLQLLIQAAAYWYDSCCLYYSSLALLAGVVQRSGEKEALGATRLLAHRLSRRC